MKIFKKILCYFGFHSFKTVIHYDRYVIWDETFCKNCGTKLKEYNRGTCYYTDDNGDDVVINRPVCEVEEIRGN